MSVSDPDRRPGEWERLAEQTVDRANDWKAFGAYLSERAWGTVREDYSPNGHAWKYFTYEDACSRAYRWSEDGLAGVCDRDQRLCFALAFWNGRDPFIKERIFGLTNLEGNHGEDVKEYWWYVDATPTASWLSWRYHYPQAAFPYARLREENARRNRDGTRIRALRHRDLRRRPLLEDRRRVREGRSIRYLHSHPCSQCWAGSGDARGPPDPLVSKPLVMGCRRGAADDRRGTIGGPRRRLRDRGR